ncbi:glycosyltransferase [Actinomadura litoris]|uniref:Glycosyltransferase n=1 Tax=Actinomadura litoris TaxID=2678616 RepID=A0A7K1KX70_9ACTN|nr:glycosyltransferase [Actinomadura litoris]MUN36801.1 glycosyltransferase [Actinomadura litoris]
MPQTRDDLIRHDPTDADADADTSAAEGAQDAAARTLAGRWHFTGPDETVSDDLYAAATGAVTRSRTRLTLAPGAKASGNAFFGRFPATYWQRWTEAREVRVELTVTGTGRLAAAASDVNGPARVVAARTVRDADRERVVLAAPLDLYADGGAIWVELEAAADGRRLTVEDVRWTVAAPASRRPTSLAFATYNRPDYCRDLLRALAADDVARARLERIYIVDHGDHVTGQDWYEEIAADFGDRLQHTPQPNLGSSGGCNRGLYEVARHASENANVMFLDDDILLEPEVVVRLTAFGDHVTRPMIVGGQMINIFHPTVLLADAQRTDIDGIQPGKPMPHAYHDADLLTPDPATGRPPLQERRLDAGYTAWWACLMPIELVERVGYMLPVWGQGEDADLCARARKNGIPTIILPGAAVWHTDFSMKDLDDVKTYFIRRNYLIVAALHGRFPVGALTRRLGTEIAQCILDMRYGLAATILSAVEDFLDGPDDLYDGGAERLQEIARMRSRYPETRRHPATAAPGAPSDRLEIVTPGRPPLLPAAAALGLAAARLRGRHRFRLGEVAHDEAHWWHVARFRTAVVTDASQEGVRVRSHDQDATVELGVRAARTLLRFSRTARDARRRYFEALPELTGRANWSRLYETGE